MEAGAFEICPNALVVDYIIDILYMHMYGGKCTLHAYGMDIVWIWYVNGMYMMCLWYVYGMYTECMWYV